MPSIFALWLPTLVSAVAVFVLSSIIHMALPWWHRSDYNALPNQAATLDALRPLAIPPGEYLAPRPAAGESMRSPAFLESVSRGPVFSINVFPNRPISMGRPLALWFVYLIIVCWAAGHLAMTALGTNRDSTMIFHTVAFSAFMAFAFALWQATIWFNRPFITTLKATIDGLVYAIVTGMIFVYFWPK